MVRQLATSFLLAGLIIMVTSLYAPPAFAYLDPGTGSMLLQGLIGVLAAAALTAKLYWHKFKALFRRKSSGNKSAADTPAESNEEA